MRSAPSPTLTGQPLNDQPLDGSLWAASAEPAGDYPALTGPTEADVVIVGAGYAGLSTALHLAERGLSATVLEAREPGFGGSGRSGGQVIPGLRHFASDLTAVYGEDAGRRAHAFGGGAADATFALIRRLGLACDARRAGWIQAADTPAALAQSRARVEAWRGGGAPVRLLGRDEIRSLIGSEAYLGGWIDPRGGTVQPLSYARSLARAASAAGARIFARSPAMSVSRVGAAWRVETPAGVASAPKLLLATNATTDGLWPRLERTILPVWSFQIATRPLSPSERRYVLPAAQAVSDTRRVLRFFRLDRDGRLVVGGKGTSHGPRSPQDFNLQALALQRLYPSLDGVEIDYRWGGQVAVTVDRLPRIVDLGPGAYANLGCNGKGVAWCTAIGAAYAEAFASGDPRALPIPTSPIEPIPFHELRRLYVGVGGAWLRFRDLIDQSSPVADLQSQSPKASP
ncbi:MAG: FAD-binding oxidoreductase [Caulobacteraceae bacterium]|nr:FAD-binding oxidoreductase [Caulobacteraceae bacterium]